MTYAAWNTRWALDLSGAIGSLIHPRASKKSAQTAYMCSTAWHRVLADWFRLEKSNLVPLCNGAAFYYPQPLPRPLKIRPRREWQCPPKHRKRLYQANQLENGG